MSLTNLKLTVEDRVAYLSIDRPPANALDSVIMTNLGKALDQLEADEQVKVIVITGEGRFFIAGADIKEFPHLSETDAANLSVAGQRLFDRMQKFPKPIIAAINGACLGAGLELAMACHIRLVAQEAKLGLPELNLGLIPGYAGTQRLPRLVGRGKATMMMLTSEMISGEEAYRLGLAEAVYPLEKLMEETKALANLIAQKSAVAMRFVLDAIETGLEQGMEAGSAREAELFGKAFMTEDMKEGVTAFIEKRKPQFKDR